MVLKRKKGVFIVWKNFQRRVEVLAPFLDLEIYYFHYSWEEKSKILKVLSYLPKSIATLICLFRKKPSLVFVQFPPTPALYCIALYSWLTGCKYVSDCHNSIINTHWSKWIFAKKLLSYGLVIVHNDHIARHVKEYLGLTSFVLRDGIMDIQPDATKHTHILEFFNLSPGSYVLLPWTFSPDEPILETIEAAKMVPDIKFVMTWYFEKLPIDLRKQMPPNVILTGYLPTDDFNQLFSSAGITLVLTKWESTQLSGMQEAMAFEIPAVVRYLKTTRYLYKNAPVYVVNEPKSIANGIRYAFQNWLEFKKKMKILRIETEKEFSDQVLNLRASLNL
jgi:glycosyltransferase involved in cell wall biosynthesis